MLIVFCLIVIVGCLIILLLGIGFDIASKRSAPTTLPIPIGLRNEISKILQTKLPVNIIRLVHERIRLAPNDLSLGGHLQGVIRQRIVVSAGLTVGLLTNDERSVAILAHEIAHVKHLDKFVPGIIVLSLLNISYCMVKFGKAGVLYAIAVLVITRYVTHRREYAADAHAVGLLGSKRMFAKTLLSLSADEEAFSHPSRDQRVDAIKRNLPILNPSAFWGVFWLVNIIGGISIPLIVKSNTALGWEELGLGGFLMNPYWAPVFMPTPGHWLFGFTLVCIGIIGISVEISKLRWV